MREEPRHAIASGVDPVILTLPKASELEITNQIVIGPMQFTVNRQHQIQKSAAEIFEEVSRTVKAGELLGLSSKEEGRQDEFSQTPNPLCR
jgi:hypothetical protein